jgi:hypothetical protein
MNRSKLTSSKTSKTPQKPKQNLQQQEQATPTTEDTGTSSKTTSFMYGARRFVVDGMDEQNLKIGDVINVGSTYEPQGK